MEFNKNSGFTPQEITLVKENLNNLNDSVEQIESEIGRIPAPFAEIGTYSTNSERTEINIDYDLSKAKEIMVVMDFKGGTTSSATLACTGSDGNFNITVPGAITTTERFHYLHFSLLGTAGIHVDHNSSGVASINFSLAGGDTLHLMKRAIKSIKVTASEIPINSTATLYVSE